jgi:hypothetical protein
VREICEGDTKFMYAMKLVLLEVQAFESPKCRVSETLNTSPLQFLSVRKCLKSKWVD